MKLDLPELRRHRRIGHYFRYPLRDADFRELRRDDGRLLGRYAAKPLYGKLTARGRVERTGGFNGRVAVLLLPPRARTTRCARLLFTRMPREQVVLANGHRNWAAIHRVAERAARRALVRENIQAPL